MASQSVPGPLDSHLDNVLEDIITDLNTELEKAASLVMTYKICTIECQTNLLSQVAGGAARGAVWHTSMADGAAIATHFAATLGLVDTSDMGSFLESTRQVIYLIVRYILKHIIPYMVDLGMASRPC